MASSAQTPQGSGLLTDQKLREKLAARRDENGDIRRGAANRIIANYLEKGRGGIAAGVVNRLNQPDSPYSSGSPLSMAYGDEPGANDSPDIAGLKGLRLGKGDVYYGSTARKIEPYQSNNYFSGSTYVPGRTEYSPIVLPRGMAGSRARGAQQASDTPESSAPNRDLLNARATYDSLNSETGSVASSGNSTSAAFDLGKTGGDLYNAIAGQGQSQIDTYKQRFIPRLLANANLTAQEIGYAGQQAINNMPDNLNLADYEDPFDKGSGPGKKQSLFNFLSSRITA